MLNPDLKLNSDIFDAKAKQAPTRDGYGEALQILGETHPNVVVLSADLTESTRAEAFASKFPERFFEMGVSEQNMASVAAGLGVSGKIPFISSYATFSPGRNWEQIRTTIAINDSNVKIAGHHAGISVGPDGATHQALEDIAMMRALPNMKVIAPSDSIEARKATLAAADIWGPVYLRFGREKSPIITTEDTPFVPGKAALYWLPVRKAKADVVIFTTGALAYEALLAAKMLEEKDIHVYVVNVHTVKPLDEDMIVEYAKKAGAVVTVEEHQVAGGFGSAVSECLSRHAPTPMEFVGMQDEFGQSGTPAELIAHFGMDAKGILAAAKKAIRRAR